MSDLLMLLLSLEDQMRGHTKDHYESYGCQGSHTTPPEEHLQKFRLGKQPHKDLNDQAARDASASEFQRDGAATSRIMGQHFNETIKLPPCQIITHLQPYLLTPSYTAKTTTSIDSEGN
ncbi:uncharacterized protein LOC111990177 isoform X2 [Quercus suber]|uniref:uncharacterized protein LOC111990177 isoform X2 n=1 Tax=Quercus suber TaxID=58331 RepID=UPI0032DE8B7C